MTVIFFEMKRLKSSIVKFQETHDLIVNFHIQFEAHLTVQQL